ncbi:hypothetical protein ANCCEY_01799 [Ancylostoma ceylanicum]|uniref:Uncharacterized protein n=1 Tax=Ancylostoma ceylanicum TaxID=53326 RepID=A0A0D6M4U5_9BILA|nr:hypothetical protein ANCCEY_01799 [Ancylostoma ceylanicum]
MSHIFEGRLLIRLSDLFEIIAELGYPNQDSMRERSGSISSARAMLPLCPSLMPSQIFLFE